MAENKKIYQIQINGVEESISAVEALNKQLTELEARIKKLESSNVKVSASSSGGGGSSKTSNVSAMSEEAKLAKQIEQIDAKREAYSKEIYQNYLAAKDVLKETVDDQKQIAAQERLQSNSYGNTMQGMKQQLADIKQVMQTTDVDSDAFKKLTADANELNSKLKELETSYGQFGRNVGNYQDAANGFKKLEITVNGVTRTFDNAKQAMMTLKKERDTLGVSVGRGTKEFQELDETVKQLQSDLKDMSKSSAAMDNLLDTMESFTAIASVSQGFSALFGIDDSEIQKSIQKLLGLQNALKGIEVINKQIQTQEGIGSIFAKGSNMVDKLVDSIFGVEKATKAATLGAKALGTALKGVGIGLIIAGVMELINLLETWSEKQEKAAKAADEAAEKIKKAIDEQREAYVSASASYMNAASRLSYLRTEYMTTNNELRKTSILKEATKQFKDLGISVNSVSDSQRILVEEGDKVIELIRLQGDAAAAAALRLEAFKKSFNTMIERGYDSKAAFYLASNNGDVVEIDKRLSRIYEQIGKLNGKLGIKTKEIGKDVGDAAKKAQEEITQMELRAMRDGLTKKLRELDIERNREIEALKKNGNITEEEIKKIYAKYDEIRSNTINDYLVNLKKQISDTARELSKTKFDIDVKDAENKIDELRTKIEKLSWENTPITNLLITEGEWKKLTKDIDKYSLKLANIFEELYKNAYSFDATEEDINNFKLLLEKFKELYEKEISELGDDVTLEEAFEKIFDKELYVIRNYGDLIDETLKDSIKDRNLKDSIEDRIAFQDKYNNIVTQKQIDFNDKMLELEKERISAQTNADLEEEKNRYTKQMESLQKEKDLNDEAIKNFKARTDKEKKQYNDMLEYQKSIQKQMEEAGIQHADKTSQIWEAQENKIKEVQLKSTQEITQIQEGYFERVIEDIRDFQNKINEEANKLPTLNNWGIVNIAATRRKNRELIDATKTVVNRIIEEQKKLDELYKNGLISPEAKNKTVGILNQLLIALKQLLGEVEKESKQTFSKFMQSAQVYIQAVMDSYRTIMDAVWDAQNNQFEKEQEELDKMNELLDKKLDEQQEIVEQHKNAIDSIEDELATSRGDRRQHLIDQLNAEMAAERAAEIEKQRIEKEREANEKKQDALEKKRRKAQYKRDLLQAIVNGAMAVTYASMNTWPVPAIPLMALAAATTAAQVAIMSANKPYAKGGQLDGGVAVGKRHRDGGIPVLGGRASIEGGEFITNRTTTAKNVDLLEYINSKKKKVDLNDLIEFYSGGTVKKSIKLVKSRFEDGGYIQPLPQALDIRDQLQNVIINQDNRPIYVSVVDINNKQEDVRRVQTLAGLTE